jgi:hypothetical protein
MWLWWTLSAACMSLCVRTFPLNCTGATAVFTYIALAHSRGSLAVVVRKAGGEKIPRQIATDVQSTHVLGAFQVVEVPPVVRDQYCFVRKIISLCGFVFMLPQ